MFPTRLHLAKRTGQVLALAALAAGLPGCQSISGTNVYTQVRFIDASPDAPGLDFYEGNSAVLYKIGFGTVSSYIPIIPATYNFSIDSTGTLQQLATVRGTLTPAGQYTVLAGNVAASLQMTVLQDQTTAAPTGQIALRFVDEATRTAAVDIYLLPSGSSLSSVGPIATNVSFGKNTGYLASPSGTFAVVVVPTGTIPTGTTSPLFTGSQAAYPGGAARTVVLLDQQLITQPGIQVVIAHDYDSPSS